MARGSPKAFLSSMTSQALDNAKSSLTDLLKETFKFQNVVELITDELKSWNEEYNSLISSLGIARSALTDIRNMQLKSVKSLAFYGIGIKNVSESTTALFDTFRSIYNVNQDLVEESAQMVRGWGISATESAEILRLQTEIFEMTKEQRLEQDKIIKSYGTLYGVGAAKIAKDIADNAEGVAKWSRNAGDNIAKAAAYARKLGAELSDILGFSEKLLDIEQSTQAAFSLQVLTGKSIDVQKMRQLAFQGDIYELTKLIGKEIEDMSGSQYENAIIQQQIADTFGISIIKVRQIQHAHRQINDELEGWTKKQKEAFKLYRQMSLIDPFKSEEAVSNITRLGEYFRAVLLPYIQSIVKAADQLAKILNDHIFGPLAKWMSGAKEREQQVAFAGMSIAVPFAFMGIFKLAQTLISGILGKVGGLFKGGAGKMGKQRMAPRQILSYSVAIAAFAGSVWILSKAAQNFASIGDKFAEAMAGILISGTLLGGFAVLLSALAPLGPAILITSAAIAVFAGAIWILSKASQNFVPLIEAISQSFINMFGAVENVSPSQLMGLSAGLTALGGSLMVLTGSSIAAGLFGTGLILTIRSLTELSKTADPLMKVANALEKISSNIQKINSTKDINLTNNLKKLSSFAFKTADNITETPARAQQEAITVRPADIYLDRYKVGEVVFELLRGKM